MISLIFLTKYSVFRILLANPPECKCSRGVCGCLEEHPAVHFQGTLWCRIERFSGGARGQNSYDASSFFGGSGSGVALRCSRSAPESAHRRRLVAQLPSDARTLCATLERVPGALGA